MDKERWRGGMGGGGRREISRRCSSFQRTPECHLLYTQMRGSQGRQCMVASSVGPPLETRLTSGLKGVSKIIIYCYWHPESWHQKVGTRNL